MITITPLELAGQDERGGTYVFDTDRSGQLIVAHRKAGSASGRHYHKGVSANKNPEKLILMKGEVEVNWKNMLGEQQGSARATGPALIVIPANLWHEVIALTDFVMLELNALKDGHGDTFRLNGDPVGY
jgi:quercetin dioxygenase-like cupin family protein